MGAGPAQTQGDGPSKSAILVSVWALSTLLWSIFTEPNKTFAARVILLQPLWLVRFAVSDPTWVQDLGLGLSLHWLYGLLWSHSWTFPTVKWTDLNSEYLHINLQIFALLGLCGGLAGSIVFRGQTLDSAEQRGPIREQRIEESLLPSLLLSSRTTHSRFFPEKHAFSYSYLFAGVPVDLRGRVSNVLSVDSASKGWFDIRSIDFLKRGQPHLSLAEKLKNYLHTQGVTDRDYAFAYLVTAPRFLGYSFNPVSFWYLYDSDAVLTMMILEVNNTFDERRMYLLRTDSSKVESSGSNDANKIQTFTETWEKDFHVSPFNSRKGSYSLRAMDPLAAFQTTGEVKIDNTITLLSSKDHPKLVARVWSSSAVEAAKMSQLQLLQFIARWWWVGLATFPRIVWEAQKLFFRRKLNVWYRPEIADTSVGRAYTADETSLEAIFRAFLTHSVENSDQPLRIVYEPAHHNEEEIVLYSPGFTYEEAHSRTLTLKVLSPAFYSRFVHYAHAKEAFDRECLATNDKNRTLVIEGVNALSVLLESMREAHKSVKTGQRNNSIINRQRWSLLRRLRCAPAATSYPVDEAPPKADYRVSDIRKFQYSDLDLYVRQSGTHESQYRQIVTTLFLAERAALGIPAVVVLGDWLIRATFLLATMAYSDSSSARVWDLLRARPVHRRDFVTGSVALLLANSVHLWSFIKG